MKRKSRFRKLRLLFRRRFLRRSRLHRPKLFKGRFSRFRLRRPRLRKPKFLARFRRKKVSKPIAQEIVVKAKKPTQAIAPSYLAITNMLTSHSHSPRQQDKTDTEQNPS